jgi:hypothetical protein
MAYNVPVVNDVFAARISETEGFAGLQKCGGVRRGSKRSDRPSRTEPEPPIGGERLQSCYAKWWRILLFYLYNYILLK